MGTAAARSEDERSQGKAESSGASPALASEGHSASPGLPSLCGSPCSRDAWIEREGAVMRMDFSYVGPGGGGYEPGVAYSFVGEGCGRYRKTTKVVTEGWRLGRYARALLVALGLAALAALLLLALWTAGGLGLGPGAAARPRAAPPRAAAEPFDCLAAPEEGGVSWPPAKRAWCCERGRFRGCRRGAAPA